MPLPRIVSRDSGTPSRRSTGTSSSFWSSSASEHAAAIRSSPYTTVRFAQRVFGKRVQPVHRVDDDRDTSDAAPRRVRTAPASGCACGRSPGAIHETRATSSTSARGVLERRHAPRRVPQRDVAHAAGARARSTYGPGADAPTTSNPRHASCSSCGPSSSSRLMSVVVTCTTSGRPSRGRRRVTAPVQAGGAARPRDAMPPAALRTNQRCPSLAWTGERASRYGSVAPIRVGAGTRDGRGAETRSHGPFGGRRTEQGLGVREVARRAPDMLADQGDRPIELVVDLGFGQPVEQAVPVRVRTDVDPDRTRTRRGAPPTTAACRRPETRCPRRCTRSPRTASPGCDDVRAPEPRGRRSRRSRRRT